MQRWPKRFVIGCAIGAAAAALTWAAGHTAFFRTVELKTYDYRVRMTADPASARRDIVLVSIDDSSIRRLESEVGRWPWPRVVHANLLDYLARGPAKVIVYDILFTERQQGSFQIEGTTWTGAESDLTLAASAARAGNVVFTADVTADEAALMGSHGVDVLRAGQPFAADPAFEARPGVILPVRRTDRRGGRRGPQLYRLRRRRPGQAFGPVRSGGRGRRAVAGRRRGDAGWARADGRYPAGAGDAESRAGVRPARAFDGFRVSTGPTRPPSAC